MNTRTTRRSYVFLLICTAGLFTVSILNRISHSINNEEFELIITERQSKVQPRIRSNHKKEQEYVVTDSATDDSVDTSESAITDSATDDSVDTSETAITDSATDDSVDTSETAITDSATDDSVDTSESAITDSATDDSVDTSETAITDSATDDSVDTSETAITDSATDDSVDTSESAITDSATDDSVDTSESAITDSATDDSVDTSKSAITDSVTDDSVDTSGTTISKTQTHPSTVEEDTEIQKEQDIAKPDSESVHTQSSEDSMGAQVALERGKAMKKKLHRCDYIRDLLARNHTIGSPLPSTTEKGRKARFWFKTPRLHTIDPESGREIMIMSYAWHGKRATQNYMNTVDILTRFHNNDLFPNLFGYCTDLDGEKMLALEFLSFDAFKLPKPKSLDDCIDRALLALDTFDKLDALGLTFVDMKRDQWMFRAQGGMVLHDVDDIVPSPHYGFGYHDQEMQYYMLVKRANTSFSDLEFHKTWQLGMFPHKRLSIRYPVLGTEMLLTGLGFEWKTDCPGYSESGIETCLQNLIQWSKSSDVEDWPDFSQLRIALESCHETGKFEKPPSKHREWNKVARLDESELTCMQQYGRKNPDDPKAVFTRCGSSCCSNSRYTMCYYTESDDKCEEGSTVTTGANGTVNSL